MSTIALHSTTRRAVSLELQLALLLCSLVYCIATFSHYFSLPRGYK